MIESGNGGASSQRGIVIEIRADGNAAWSVRPPDLNPVQLVAVLRMVADVIDRQLVAAEVVRRAESGIALARSLPKPGAGGFR